MTRRQARVNDLLREVLAEILQRDLKDPRLDLTLLSVTEVQVSPDLRSARVHVSVLGTDQQRRDAITALTRADGYIRRLLRSRLDLRTVPQLRFTSDDRIEQGRRLQDLLDDLHTDEAAPPDGEP